MIIGQIRIIKKILKLMEVRVYHIVSLSILSVSIAIFSGLGVVLLIPFAQGIMHNDFSFLMETPGVEIVISTFPQVVDYFKQERYWAFVLIVVLIVLTELLRVVFQYTSSVITGKWGEVFSARVHNKIFKRYLSFGKQYFDRRPAGSLGVLINYAQQLPKLFNCFRMFSDSLLQLLIMVSVLLLISWKLVVIVAALFIVLYYVVQKLFIRIYKISEEELELRRKFNKKFYEMISLIPLVKGYAREEESENAYACITNEVQHYRTHVTIISNLAEPTQAISILSALVCILVYAIINIQRGADLSILSAHIVFFYGVFRCVPILRYFHRSGIMYAQIAPQLIQILDIFNTEEIDAIPEGSIQFDGLKEEISFKGLSFSYDKQPALTNVTFVIPKNTTVAVVGPSGAGKSTLANLLVRFYDCPPQSIFIDGTDIREFALKSLRKRIAFISHDPLLFNDTIRNNIQYGLDRVISDAEMIEVIKKARLEDCIDSLPRALETCIGDRGIALSAGEKQRVAIARMLLKKPEILILDEATNSLDIRTETLIREAMEEVVKGRTTIVIAHRLSTIKRADSIIVLNQGQVIEEGSFESLIKKDGMFNQLWQEMKNAFDE